MRNKGFSLIEVLIAVIILSVAVLAIARLQDTGLKAVREARLMRQATDLARAKLEQLRANPGGIPGQCQGNQALGGGFVLSCSQTTCSSISSSGSCTAGVGTAAYQISMQVNRQNKEYLNLQTVVTP